MRDEDEELVDLLIADAYVDPSARGKGYRDELLSRLRRGKKCEEAVKKIQSICQYEATSVHNSHFDDILTLCDTALRENSSE